MKPLELAHRYMKIFYSGRNIEKLKEILAVDLFFEGPLYKFNSAEDYINSLKADPPKGIRYKIIKSFEDESSACIIYLFSKEGISTPMAQLFEVKNDNISKIKLIFDTNVFMKRVPYDHNKKL